MLNFEPQTNHPDMQNKPFFFLGILSLGIGYALFKLNEKEKLAISKSEQIIVSMGRLTIFNVPSTHITLQGFKGTIVWYTSPQLMSDAVPAQPKLDFDPIMSIPPVEFDGTKKTVEIPQGAHAFMMSKNQQKQIPCTLRIEDP